MTEFDLSDKEKRILIVSAEALFRADESVYKIVHDITRWIELLVEQQKNQPVVAAVALGVVRKKVAEAETHAWARARSGYASALQAMMAVADRMPGPKPPKPKPPSKPEESSDGDQAPASE